MKKFNLIFEEYMYSLTDGDVDTEKIEKTYRSLDQFKQFCKKILLFVQIVKDANKLENRKFIGANLYFINNNNKDISKPFDYYLKNNYKYYTDNKDIFIALTDYKNKYIVTLDGKKDSPIILWG